MKASQGLYMNVCFCKKRRLTEEAGLRTEGRYWVAIHEPTDLTPRGGCLVLLKACSQHRRSISRWSHVSGLLRQHCAIKA